MNTATRTIIAAAFAAPLLGLVPTGADAAQRSIAKTQNDGYRACQALGNSGYTGIVRGERLYALDGIAGGKKKSFSIRYCFESRAKCSHFINRIKHTVRNVETIRYSTCERRA